MPLIKNTLKVSAAALVAGFALTSVTVACEKPEIKISYSSVVNPDPHHPYYVASQTFKEVVEQETNCKVQVDLFMGGQLGGDRETFEAIMIGTQDMGLISSPPISAASTAVEALNLPWLFRGDLELLKATVNGEPGKWMFEALEADTGVKPLAVTVVPFRNIISVKPVKAVEDLSGLKIRVMQSPSNIATFRAVGANPTPISPAEVYGAVQTGVVDATETDVLGMYAGKLHEVAKNVTISGHFNNPAVMVINADVFAGYDEETQAAILKAAAAAAEKSYEVSYSEADKVTEILKSENNVSFHEIDVEQLQSAIGSVYDDATKASEVTKRVVDAVNELAAQ